MGTLVEAAEMRLQVNELLDNPLPSMPPHEQKVGVTTVRWWEPNSGDAVIMAEGGTVDDRTLGEFVTKELLAIHGYRRVSFYPGPQFEKEAAWDDVAVKAKRLKDAGNVTLLRNGYNNVVGHVIGDHGEYDTEIGRDDPTSRAITTWTCECPWDQYAWQRTRQWKKYEGRPCAHVMATLWKAMETPLDEELDQQQAEGMGTGQAIGPGAGTPLPGSGQPSPAPSPVPVGPQGEIQGDQMSLMTGEPETTMPISEDPAAKTPYAQQPLAPPAPNDVLPPFPGEQMQIPEFPVPGQTPSGFQAPPNSISVPGAKPQTPWNPTQYPGGTYSDMEPSTRVRLKKPAWGLTEPRADEYGGKIDPNQTGQYKEIPEGTQGEVLSEDETTGWVEAIFPLEGGPRSEYMVRCFLEPGDLDVLPGSPSRTWYPRNLRH